MAWVLPLIVLVAFVVLIEWTSRPRGSAKDAGTADTEVKIPRPRKPAPGWTRTSARRTGDDR